MERTILWTLLSCLLIPVTAWTCLQTWISLTTTTTDTSPYLNRLLVILAAIALKTQHTFLSNLLFETRARRLGCLPARWYPHRDPVLGTDFVRLLMAWMGDNTFLPRTAALFADVGHTFYARTLLRDTLWTDEPDNVRAVLAADFDAWPIGGARLQAVLPQLGPGSIFASNGAAWHRARATIRPSFVRDQVADMRCFDRHAERLCGRIEETKGATFDLQDLVLKMTMDVSTDFLLGRSTGLLLAGEATDEAERFIEAYEYCNYEGARTARSGLGGVWFNRRFRESIKTIRGYVRFYVKQTMAERDRDGGKLEKERGYVFLDELVGAGVDEEYVVDQVLSIIIAGRDTTAAAMTAMFWYVARMPDVQRRLRAEMEEMGVADPDWEQLKGMSYLQNVVKETLRLFPPISSNSRVANREVVLPRGGGPDGQSPLLVPKGTAVRYHTYATQRRKEIFGADADEFRPERWEERRTGWEYTPFSGGPRVCIGQQFALTQLTLTMFRVLQRFGRIEARDEGEMRIKVSISSSLPEPGCLVAMGV